MRPLKKRLAGSVLGRLAHGTARAASARPALIVFLSALAAFGAREAYRVGQVQSLRQAAAQEATKRSTAEQAAAVAESEAEALRAAVAVIEAAHDRQLNALGEAATVLKEQTERARRAREDEGRLLAQAGEAMAACLALDLAVALGPDAAAGMFDDFSGTEDRDQDEGGRDPGTPGLSR